MATAVQFNRGALDYRHLARTEKRDAKKNRAGTFTGAISLKDNQIKSGLAFLRIRGFFALRFQLRELLGRKNSFGLIEECFPAFLCATGLHAFALPRFDFCLLIGREIERCQINACH